MTDLVITEKIEEARKITVEDIQEGKRLLGYTSKGFSGETVLNNIYVTEICDKINNSESSVSISNWLREENEKLPAGEVCYVSHVTLTDFRKNWYNHIKEKAVDGLTGNDYPDIRIAGIKFRRAVLEREGCFVKGLEKESDFVVDGRRELTEYLEFVKDNLKNDEKNRIHWSKEWRYTIESHIKLLGDAAQSPQLHLELFQHEISIYIEANIQALRELYGSDREAEYLERFEEKYKKLAILKGSMFADKEEA